MYWFIKKYTVLLVIAFLWASSMPVKAQVSDSVNIRCVSVDATGGVTLTWVLPPAANLSADGWTDYTIYASSTNIVGSYSNIAVTPPISITQTSVTIPSATLLSILHANATTQQIYFYISTDNTTPNPTYFSNVVSTIYLTINNPGNDIADLYWNPVSNPLPQGSSTWYQIWREANNSNVWTLVDSTQSYSYADTVMYCDSISLNYRVQIADSTICTSMSNVSRNVSKFISGFGPPQVVMDTVSVNPDNSVDITWQKSSKKNVIGYIIYATVVNVTNHPLDTVWGINSTDLLHYFGGGNPSDSILYFTVAALDSCKLVGAISNYQETILLQVSPDVCAQTNTLKWNGYENLAGNSGGDGIGGYNVYRSLNHGPFQLLASVDSHTLSYTDTNLVVNDSTCYYIQVYESGHIDTTASSNIVCDIIQSSFHPKNNYLREATVILNTKSVEIAGYVDSSSRAAYYVFQRSEYPAGGFSTIYTMNAPAHSDSISYIDNGVNPDGRSYYYRILTLDSCNKAIDSTNTGQTMLLNAVGQPNGINTLTWNDYGTWYAGPAYYTIYRSIDGINYNQLTPNVPYTNAGENTFNDDVSDITNGEGTFYYYVKAVEDTNMSYPYPFVDTCLSNVTEAYQAPTIFIPDAFCPTGKNKIFKPVGLYISSQGYDLSILNRWGDLVFETNDPDVGWDGTYKGGKIVQEGVYVYLLTYTSSRGEYFQKKGTVTLIK